VSLYIYVISISNRKEIEGKNYINMCARVCARVCNVRI